jgi:hypothetical protein
MQTRALSARVCVRPHRHRLDGRHGGFGIKKMLVSESVAVHRVGVRRLRYPPQEARFRPPFNAHPNPNGFPSPLTKLPLTPHPADYRSDGSIISANEFRALFNRDFTVPRLQCVISAISSYERPSISRNTNTSR